jgi:Zn-finger nucleic acid-binding protein
MGDKCARSFSERGGEGKPVKFSLDSPPGRWQLDAMQCPACARKLRRLKAGTVTLDACQGGCGGIWFDRDELDGVNREHGKTSDKVAEVTRDPAVSVDEASARSCPRCQRATALEQKLYTLGSGVILDRCPECEGVWLDHGELEKIRETLHPRARHRRYVERAPAPVMDNVAIDLAIIQQVQILHFGPRA